MVKKFAIILFAGLLVFAMVACKAKGGTADTNGSSTSAPSSKPLAPVEDGDDLGDDFTSDQESSFVSGVDPDLDFGDSSNDSSSNENSSSDSTSSDSTSSGDTSSDGSSSGNASNDSSSDVSSSTSSGDRWTSTY